MIRWDEPRWLARFWRLAEEAASWSKDPVRQVGAVLVTPDMRQLSLGYNGPPQGFPDKRISDLSADAKRMVMVHAEANALGNACFDKRECALLVTRHPCAACAGLIIAAGVTRLVCPVPAGEFSKWHQEHQMANRLFRLAGLSVRHRTEDGRYMSNLGML